MHNQMENLPDEIFEIFQTKNWNELSASEKKVMLNYFEQDEYAAIKQSLVYIKNRNTKNSSKEKLLAEFDRTYNSANTIFAISSWKVAAVLLLLGIGVLQFFILNKPTNNNFTTSIVDTIYLVKNVVSKPLHIHDTIFVAHQNKVYKAYQPTIVSNIKTVLPQQEHETVPQDNFEILPLKNLQGRVSNNQKGNSIKNDSLIQQFQFVTL